MIKFTPAPFTDDLNLDHWPRWTTYYFDVFKAIQMRNALINQIIKHAPLVGDRKHTLLSTRTQYLELGHDTSSLKKMWHVDTPSDPEALHHLYVIGENRTEFKLDDLTTIPMPKGHYVTYSSKDEHRGVPVHTEEFRLFVRIEELNNDDEERTSSLATYFPVVYPSGKESYHIDEESYYNLFTEKAYLNRGAVSG